MSPKEIKAFSLVEISVVLLIVAIFIAAISSGKLLLDKSEAIQLQQALQSQLESQEYYSERSFEVDAASISDPESGCGANPSDLAIIDFLYNPTLSASDGGCCTNKDTLASLCCHTPASGSCLCGTSGYPDCLCIATNNPVGCP